MSSNCRQDDTFYSQRRESRAVRSTYIAFIGTGFAFASWASRIPQVRDQLALSSSDLGLVLLAIALGALLALPMSGMIIHRIGSRATIQIMAIVLAIGLVVIAVGYRIGLVPLLIGLFALGFANGAWDVAMNVHGALVEKRIGRVIMPRFHASFSAGTVAGALIGAAMVALDVPVTVHLSIVAVIIVLAIPMGVREFLPDADVAPELGLVEETTHPLARWREPRTLLIGVVVLAFSFAEGSANDWISVALIDGYDASAVVGTVGFAAFLMAMTAMRWFGAGLLDRFGRVTVLRGLASVSALGVILFVFSPNVPLALVGVVLWGLGASMGFPVGMSAAADDPRAAAGRVSVVASIGYFAFLGGPPLIGFVGEHASVLRALLIVALLLGLVVFITNALKPQQTS